MTNHMRVAGMGGGGVTDDSFFPGLDGVVATKATCVEGALTLELFEDSNCFVPSQDLPSMVVNGCTAVGSLSPFAYIDGVCDQPCATVNAMGNYVVKPVSEKKR